MPAKAISHSAKMLNDTPPSRASSLPQGMQGDRRKRCHPVSNVGVSLLAMAVQRAKQVFARSIKRRGTS
ncbi:hypothetical protein C9I49_20190 [Pseudomonas prosekii]|uniref:Uncharacterized protein n=1 Tax=Pseudomonas prosekii TaxID=1148509 RepID=A0A2U2D487_9PSED|nr:hypothetical protein C9I49_20190 [Pseudomonas prosekii]